MKWRAGGAVGKKVRLTGIATGQTRVRKEVCSSAGDRCRGETPHGQQSFAVWGCGGGGVVGWWGVFCGVLTEKENAVFVLAPFFY